MNAPVAFLAGGRLHVKDGDEPPRAVESRFAETVRDRAVLTARENAWKIPRAAPGSGGPAPGNPILPTVPTVLRIAVTDVGRAPEPGLLLYALDTDDDVGLFTLDPATGEERRLVHGTDRRIRFPCGRPGVDKIVCSVLAEGGMAHLALLNADGSDLVEITEGESLDLAPSWVPGQPQIAYQTAGIGRDRQGRVVGAGPASVQLLDVPTATITPLLEDARFDFLGPRVARDGTVYAIRRPHRATGGGAPFRAAASVARLPLRMVSAVLGRKGDEALAPELASSKLVRKRPGGELEELTSGILAFDLADDGSLICTDGTAIDQLAPDGTRERLCRGELIEQVVALGGRAKGRPKTRLPDNLPRA